jgi:predicted heme/steroid binding protein
MTDDVASLKERVFTERELQQFDGTRGKPAYIAYEGVVYDVTASSLWRGGQHKDLHCAGTDLTRTKLRTPGGPPSHGEEYGQAPHTVEVFTHATVKRVGRLSNDS